MSELTSRFRQTTGHGVPAPLPAGAGAPSLAAPSAQGRAGAEPRRLGRAASQHATGGERVNGRKRRGVAAPLDRGGKGVEKWVE
jgi:hypothetical protein